VQQLYFWIDDNPGSYFLWTENTFSHPGVGPWSYRFTQIPSY